MIERYKHQTCFIQSYSKNIFLEENLVIIIIFKACKFQLDNNASVKHITLDNKFYVFPILKIIVYIVIAKLKKFEEYICLKK